MNSTIIDSKATSRKIGPLLVLASMSMLLASCSVDPGTGPSSVPPSGQQGSGQHLLPFPWWDHGSGEPSREAKDSAALERTSVWPLAEKNSWTYRWTSYDSTGTIDERRVVVETVRRNVTIAGVYWSVLSRQWTDGDSSELIARTDERGRHWLYDKVRQAGYIAYDLRATAGATYRWNDSDVDVVVIGRDVKVNVPAGTYRCCKYAIGDDRVVYCCAGIGRVKTEIYAPATSGEPRRLISSEELVYARFN